MRDPDRIDEITQVLRALWKSYPSLRLGQLIESILRSNDSDSLDLDGSEFRQDLFYREDDKWLSEMKRITKNGF